MVEPTAIDSYLLRNLHGGCLSLYSQIQSSQKSVGIKLTEMMKNEAAPVVPTCRDAEW